MKKKLFIFILILSPNIIWSQDTINQVPPASISQINKEKFLKKTRDYMNSYGSYRINFGVNQDGYVGMADNSSRFGLTGELPISKLLKAIAGIELGARLINQDETINFRGDPGYQVGQANSTLFGRLGFVGFKHKYFSFTIGKQWSAYYDVASYTDMLWAFGGTGSSTFNNNTDGGVSGTGRANQLFLFRSGNEYLKIAVQVQTRNITENVKKFADTYGGSIQYISKIGIKGGVAFVVANDGVDAPTPLQAKKGDQSYVASLAYQKGGWYIAFLMSQFYQHESVQVNDSLKTFYDGNGSEAYISYNYGQSKQWKASSAINLLWPKTSQGIDKLLDAYFVAEYSYIFSRESIVFITFKHDFGSNALGEKLNGSIIGMGLRFSFGY